MFNQEKADAVCLRVTNGESLRSACEAEGLTHPTFLRWCHEDKALSDQYTRARAIGTDVEFEGLQDLADEPPEKTAAGNVDPGWVAWQRNRIDVRKWALSKKAPKKYGDKIETTHELGESVGRIVREIVRAG
jgi:hypothetical protein